MKLTRRQFLRLTGAAAIGASLAGSGCTTESATTGRRQASEPVGDQAYLAVAHGGDPAAITKAALAALGGIERFVRSGDNVIIKPNICVDYHPPEYAATTNPTVVATLVTSTAVSVCGVVGFIGLIVPHVVRLIWGPDHRFLLPMSALCGAVFVILADGIARTVLSPTELPVGVVTVFCGAPFFLYLLRQKRHSF